MDQGLSCSIIIPVLNQYRHTEQCIRSIARNTRGIEFEVIVLDNGSSDETPGALPLLAQELPFLRVQSNQSNLGFSRANNQGAELASGELLLFLNNDTIVQPNWLRHLMAAMTTEVGLCGPKLSYPFTHNINHAGYVYNRAISKFYPIYHNFSALHPAVNKERDYQALLGACVLMRKADFLALGGFRDFGLEDVDLCLRVGRAGKQVRYVPSSEVLHYGSLTLLNTNPELLAKATTAEFNQSWPPQTLRADDLDYYAQDGFRFEINSEQEFILERLDRPFYGLLAEAQELIQHGDTARAREVLQRASAVEPSSKELIVQLVALAVAAGSPAAAREELFRLIELDPLHLEAYIMAAQLSLKLGHRPAACDVLMRLSSSPDLPFEILDQAKALLSMAAAN